ncbi:MAG: bifunctional adenosylcobinamide kinase/adenosylcobinamide-phosphate guanylyltransferase [Clostridiaceae bacterium]|nr:bifunctional adenosylcobinamide kinase/adenosylcobinamide-phosphate guanylyltransferase [Clostridiaceae bacterium]
MGKFILVTGGSRSGKSSFAETLAKQMNSDVLYIATSIPFDDEMRLRVQKHREQRPCTWSLLETYKDLDVLQNDVYKHKKVFLLDCITLMVSNIMLEKAFDWDNLNNESIEEVENCVRMEMEKLLSSIEKLPGDFIAVTNEVGMGIVPENKLSRIFRDIAGRANQMLAQKADEVYLCVSGVPVKIK